MIEKLILRNNPEAWVEMISTTLAVFLGMRLILRLIEWRAKKDPWVKKYDLLRVLVRLATRISTLTMLAVALYFGVQSLDLPKRISPWIDRAVFLIVALQVAKWLSVLVDSFFDQTFRQEEVRPRGEVAQNSTVDVLSLLTKAVVYGIAVLVILNNIGVNITALVTGLGVGGIAVALALQNILGDLFASLTIILDKTFLVGDAIRVGELQGRIERLGLKTTRIRSLTGEQIIIPNAALLQNQIRNFERMQERQIKFTLGVVYETTPDLLRKIPELIRGIVASHDDLRMDFVHFSTFGDSALIFDVAYFFLGGNFNAHMGARERVGLEIVEAFRANGIEFAYPTQSVHLVGAPQS